MTHQHDGQGGSYVIDETGERVLVERTRAPGETPPAPAEQATNTESADADFFSPVAPADQSTTE